MKKIVTVVTASVSAVLVRGIFAEQLRRGWMPYYISSPGPEVETLLEDGVTEFFPVVMDRNPNPAKDIFSLGALVAVFLKIRPDVVNTGTPKAGFLGILAAYLLRVPIRVYTIHGFRHESLLGVRRKLQIFIERAVCRMATHVLAVSQSVIEEGFKQRIFGAKQPIVLGSGSCGVLLDEFEIGLDRAAFQRVFAERFLANPPGFIVGFVGRLVPRKGIAELYAAWKQVHKEYPTSRLVLVGEYEDEQQLDPNLIRDIASDSSVISVGFVKNVADYMSVFDLLVLPSHWEGFGNVLIEAASMGLPVVSTLGTGTRDAVQDGYNGTLVPVGDVDALQNAILKYINDPSLVKEHGSNGVIWSKKFDRRNAYAPQLCDFYESIFVHKKP